MNERDDADRPLVTLHINTERTWRGGERQTLLLATGLRDRGHVAEIVCPPGAPLGERARAEGLTTHEFSLRGELNLRAIARLRRLYRRRDADIVQMHTSHAHTLGVLARFGRRRPRTIVARRVDYSIHRSGTPGFTRLKYGHGVDRYIAISEAIGEVLVSDGIDRDRISVVHSGVVPHPPPRTDRAAIRASLEIPADAPVVGNVAHLAKHKGQVHLVRAFPAVLEAHPDAHLVIVGDGEEKDGLAAEIARLELGGRVHLAGFQSDVAAWLAAFDLFVMPSEQEGLCTSILDALTAGLPVVGSRVGGIPEIIEPERTGLLAPVGDSAALAAAIRRLLGDRSFAGALAAAGQEKVAARFSADAMVEGSLRVYRALLAAEASRARDAKSGNAAR